MIGLPDGTPIYLCTEPVDFRKGFDGLTGIVTTSLDKSVTDGSLFLFVNRKRDRIKALWWETGGLTLWYRRLEQGTVELPTSQCEQAHVTIDSVELAMWIAGVSLKSAKTRRKRMKVA
ncbi:IS66 family insertion sequence element accessory protein TnpB [Aporhodopirellula aestuarii]|uniref:IS66 family insertion sequence element accessory protein TnpB n=1 Tax=Aporhodopirellula aestuarii TaxID=2950107 RepID=A0ABT0UCQ0_9BACT|nr:IS66 family insertion sequence element accessory protein TnpB [Aporhodopirellula aestuarii]MCM2374582.1 IS66 family insertion sequence element accessory protein TnpB [Aporhodopirellula aestuarii]